jgi:5-methylcytosine-specific restriction endonuclease McrA
MNYLRIHDAIINNAKAQNRSKKTGIYELHHITMRSMGGDDSQENLVLLTPREHFLIHFLLWKQNLNDRRFRDPIFMFKHKGASNSRLYEVARISHINEMKTNNPSLYLDEETKLAKRNKLKQYVKTQQHRKNISKANKGKTPRSGAVLSEDIKNKISESVSHWHKENVVSQETREKIRIASTGRKHSDYSLEKMKQKALARPKYECIHCGITMDAGNLKQHIMKKHSDAITHRL